MKQFTLLLTSATVLLSGLVSAHPGHGAAAGQNEMDLLKPRLLLNSTSGTLANDTSNGNSSDSTATAEDHIPIFKAADCVCPAAVCDSRMNAKSVSLPPHNNPTLCSFQRVILAHPTQKKNTHIMALWTVRRVMQTIIAAAIMSHIMILLHSLLLCTDSYWFVVIRYVNVRLRPNSLATSNPQADAPSLPTM